MVRLHFSAVLVTVILYYSAIKVNSKDILSWEEDHFIKELSDEDIPEDCQQFGICSNVTIYDTEFINKFSKSLRIFNRDSIMKQSYGRPDDIELCEAKEELIWPQAARDDEGKWQYIVNTDAVRFQSYRTQICIESGSKCSKLATFVGVEDACYQEFYFRNMVYIDIKNKKFATKYFQVPNCCTCKITEINPCQRWYTLA